jgi:hypothetical protein
LNASTKFCIFDKEVLFFGAGSRDTSHLVYLLLTVHRHELIGKKIGGFAGSKTTERGRMGYLALSNAVALVLNAFLFLYKITRTELSLKPWPDTQTPRLPRALDSPFKKPFSPSRNTLLSFHLPTCTVTT